MTYVSTVLADGAVGFWEFAEPSGTTATDQTGISNGTYTNTSGITLGQTGIPGGAGATACRFTAASAGYVSAPAVGGNAIVDVFTLEVWVKRATTSGTQFFWGLDRPRVYFDVGTVTFQARGISTIATASVGITDTTVFHHIVVTKSGATTHIYIDGVDVTVNAATNTFTADAGPYVIGAGDAIGTAPVDATMAMAAIYPTALSSTKVADHYAQGSAVVVSSQPPALRITYIA